MKSISRDTPLSEITLRKYERPYSTSKRDSIRKLCLSIGLLQPGDSRDVVVDVFQALLEAKSKKQMLNSEEIRDKAVSLRKQKKLPLKGIASSNIRRQLKRLKDLHLVENIKNEYRITEFENVSIIFENQIKEFYLKSILDRVQEHFEAIK